MHSTNFPLNTHEKKNFIVSQSSKLRILVFSEYPERISNNQTQKAGKKKIGTHKERQIPISYLYHT